MCNGVGGVGGQSAGLIPQASQANVAAQPASVRPQSVASSANAFTLTPQVSASSVNPPVSSSNSLSASNGINWDSLWTYDPHSFGTQLFGGQTNFFI
jgi:hypothetical protein